MSENWPNQSDPPGGDYCDSAGEPFETDNEPNTDEDFAEIDAYSSYDDDEPTGEDCEGALVDDLAAEGIDLTENDLAAIDGYRGWCSIFSDQSRRAHSLTANAALERTNQR